MLPGHIVGYVYIMTMAVVMFTLLKAPMTASLMTPEDFARRRNTWIGVTTAAFLSHSFWLFVAATSVIVLLSAHRERNKPALFLLLLLTVPNFENEVPGFGVVNFLFLMSPARLLSLLILVPLAFRLVQMRQPSDGLQKTSQGFVLAFAAMSAIVLAMADSPINTLANNVRNALDLLLLMVVPFYVMTHALRDLRQLREALACLILGFVMLGVFALFEGMRSWLVFESLREPLGLPPPRLTLYVMRETDGGGRLRAMATAGHPIVLGYFMGVGLCLWVALRQVLLPRILALTAVFAFVVGALSALSRGPWVGAAAGLLALTVAGPNTGKRLLATSAVVGAGVLGLLATPYADKVIAWIPFVGTAERGTVDYRVRLIEVSMTIFWDNPIFGNFNAILDPRLEQMRQGQGIIDMVNTYLGVGLQYGGVGVVLFVTPFVIACVAGFLRARSVEPLHPSLGITGRGVAGVMVITLVTIATTSSVEYMPMVYWPLVGCATAYLGLVSRWRRAQTSMAQRPVAVRGLAAAMRRPVAAKAAPVRGPARPRAMPHAIGDAARTAAALPAAAATASADAAASAGAVASGTTGHDPAASPHRPARPRAPRRGAVGGATGAAPAHRTYPDRTS
jgi:hypothetical protein